MFAGSSRADTLPFTVRHEIVREDGVLVSRPKPLDKEIARIVESNNFESLEAYSQWLGENVHYRKDESRDVWADPQETLKKRGGDCEDFAFLNFEVLKVLGYQPRFFALVREGEAHAICVFKKDGFYMWFDNATLKKTDARDLREFAESVTKRHNFLKLSELNIGTRGWETVYRRL